MNATGIILAGGKSSRMGTDKGLIELNGKKMVQYLIDVFKSLGLPVIIVANNVEYGSFEAKFVQDRIKDHGPLAGIATGLFYSSTEKNVILSCDTPFITSELISFLLEESENETITITKSFDRLHPLIGVYSKSCLPIIEQELDKNNLRLRDLCDKVNAKTVDVSNNDQFNSPDLFKNINTKEELEKLKV